METKEMEQEEKIPPVEEPTEEKKPKEMEDHEEVMD